MMGQVNLKKSYVMKPALPIPSSSAHAPLSKDKMALNKLWRPLLLSLLLFAVMAAAALWNWRIMLEREERDAQNRFTLDVEAISQNLHERMRAYEVVLRGLSGAFTGEEINVSLAQWNEVMERLQIQLIYPGISSLAWARELRADQMGVFLTRIHGDGRPDFQIFPPGERDLYHIIEYISPLNTNTRAALGLDIRTQNVQNQAVRQATDRGDPVLSVPLPLYPHPNISDVRQMGAFMYLPVYQRGIPPNQLEDRRASLLGTVNIAFRGQELVESVFGSQLRLFHIRAHDVETGEALFDSQLTKQIDPDSDWQPRFRTSRELSLYGRIWAMDIIGTQEYERGLTTERSQNITLILELLVSALISLMAASFLLSRDRKLHASTQLAASLREQAHQLTLANRYKSEFLANMSHELRTPLNSILILSDQLRQNVSGNLNEKQIRHADIVYRAGSDLLQLINDVLDLAKIEAGRVQANLEPVNLTNLLIDLDAGMQPLAAVKGLNLHISTTLEAAGVPQRIQTDRVRLHQILRNLLSNAIKFTDHGQVQLMISTGETLSDGRLMLHFTVHDTGIGIASDQQEEVFNAFTQIDGSTKRRFGGTGLGLAITKQLVEVLEGTIELQSTPGQGATFIVKLPCYPVQSTIAAEQTPPQRSGEGLPLLIVEDDKNFAAAILDKAHASGFACVHCLSGNQALDLLRQENFVAIILDLLLPDISGWQLFRRLRTMEQHRTTPVHIISCLPQPVGLTAEHGTHYLTKPLEDDMLEQVIANLKNDVQNYPSLMLVEDVEHERVHYAQKLKKLGFDVTVCDSTKAACEIWVDKNFDVLVVDLNLPDGDGFNLLDKLDKIRPLENTRIVINTGIDIGKEGTQKLDQYSAVAVCKKGEDTSQLSHAVQGFLGQINSPSRSGSDDVPLSSTNPARNRRLLLVDDDVRNVYAMSALLDEFGLEIITASNGEEAIECFKTQSPDLIFMDMSMPIMDGYTATNLLKKEHGATIPIIAMTAHAMVGDREKCLAAGTDDYLAKPVKREELQAIFARWLPAE